MLNNSKAFSSYSTNDVEKAREFYRTILGLRVEDDPMGVLHLHISGSTPVIIYPKPDHQPAPFTVLNFPVENIESAVDHLTGKGVMFEQYGAPIQTDGKGICRNDNGPAIAWFKDPAGNILSLIETKL